MIGKLKRHLQRQQFNPGFLGIFMNPHYLMRRAIYKVMREQVPNLNGKILDIGCGVKPYQQLFVNTSSYTGMEFDSNEQREKSQAEIFYDGKKFPFKNKTFDSIIFTEVLEHIFNPDEFLSEVNRVLKTNGTILLSTPFIWYEHSHPYDYGRYSSFGLKHILEKHGFEITVQQKLVSDISVIFQLVTGYIYTKISWIKSYKIKLILYVVLISPWTVLGIIVAKILPKSTDIYLDNFVIAKKYARK